MDLPQQISSHEAIINLRKTLNDHIHSSQTNTEKLYKKTYETFIAALTSTYLLPFDLINILNLEGLQTNSQENETLLKSAFLNAFLFKFKTNHFLTNLYKHSFETSYNLNNSAFSKIINANLYLKVQQNTSFFLKYKDFLKYLLIDKFDSIICFSEKIDSKNNNKKPSEFSLETNIIIFKLLEYFLCENLISKEFYVKQIDVNKYLGKIREIYTGKNLERMFVLLNRINVFSGNHRAKFQVSSVLENPLNIYSHHLRSLIIYQRYWPQCADTIDKTLCGVLNGIIRFFTGKQICYLLCLFKCLVSEVQKSTHAENKSFIQQTDIYKQTLLVIKPALSLQISFASKSYRTATSLQTNQTTTSLFTNIIFTSVYLNEAIDAYFHRLFRNEIKNMVQIDKFKIFVYSLIHYNKDSINYGKNIKPELKCNIYRQHIELLNQKPRPLAPYILLNFINNITETDCASCLAFFTAAQLKQSLQINYKKLDKSLEKKYNLRQPSTIITKFIIRMLQKFSIDNITSVFKHLPVLKYVLIKTTKKSLELLLKLLPKFVSEEIRKQIDVPLIPYLVAVLLINKISDSKLNEYIVYFNREELNLYLSCFVPFLLKRTRESFSSKMFSVPSFFKFEHDSKFNDFMVFLDSKNEFLSSFSKHVNSFSKIVSSGGGLSTAGNVRKTFNIGGSTPNSHSEEIIEDRSDIVLNKITNANLKHVSAFGLCFLIDAYLFLATDFDTAFLKKLVKISTILSKDSLNEKYLNGINSLILGILINRVYSDSLILDTIRLKYFLKYYEAVSISPSKPINFTNKEVIKTYALKYPFKNEQLTLSFSGRKFSENNEELEILFYKKNKLRGQILIHLLYKLNTFFEFADFMLLLSFVKIQKIQKKTYFKTKIFFEVKITESHWDSRGESVFFEKEYSKLQKRVQSQNQIHCEDLFQIIFNYEILKYFNSHLDYSVDLKRYKQVFLLFHLQEEDILRELFLFKTYSIFYFMKPSLSFSQNHTQREEAFNLQMSSFQKERSKEVSSPTDFSGMKEKYDSESEELEKSVTSFTAHQIPRTFSLLDFTSFVSLLNFSSQLKTDFVLYSNELDNLQFFIPQNIAKLKNSKDLSCVNQYFTVLKKIDITEERSIEFVLILVLHLISNGGTFEKQTVEKILRKRSKDNDITDTDKTQVITELFRPSSDALIGELPETVIKVSPDDEILTTFLSVLLETILEIIPIIITSISFLTALLNISSNLIELKTAPDLEQILSCEMQTMNKFIKSHRNKIWFYGFVQSIDETPLVLRSAQKAPLKCVFNYKHKSKSFIFKAKDDCRQDNLAVQLIEFMKKIFLDHKIEITLIKYDVTPLKDGGVIHMLENTISRHQMSQQFSNDLSEFYLLTYNNQPGCIWNFLKSFVGYSLFSYLFNVKDRHNANILFDKLGFIIHIDFGFMFDISPGNLNLEPHFKLTKEILDFLNRNSLVEKFYDLFIKGFFILRDNYDSIVYLINEMDLPCFTNKTINNLKRRFFLDSSEEQVINKLKKLIFKCSDSSWAKWYDLYQGIVNDIRY
ncbi:Phosphatidylinositol 4-kinase STT4 [Cucumispora dikerogammari]|nr:Phosphatidylinositol 4-kinase STT4 [Cucumispora dikerogammari]